ncbi:MAG: 2-C-methyl-D-erythritol 2,4-cyclodiphosphate synthase, partial [Deltaproteobacteria bacterium RIFCSPHIGHO2_02_FULL_40_11]
IHDGARPFVSEALFTRLWQKRDQGAVIPVLEISDTVKEVQAESVQKTHDRSVLRVAQTPQLFQFDLIWKGYESLQKTKHPVTDDASVLELIGEKVTIVKGEVQNIKITVAEDLYGTSNQIDPSSPVVRVGMGIDIHAFQEGTQVTLGGIQIPYHKALKGHSDADVLTHSICDAILGAASLGDIGTHFPDTDESYRNISSLDLLEKVVDKIQARRYKINHIDATVLAETPKLMPYISEIKQRLAHVLKVSVDQVSIKATTAEKLGFIGRSEGIAAQALATLFRGYNRDLQK